MFYLQPLSCSIKTAGKQVVENTTIRKEDENGCKIND